MVNINVKVTMWFYIMKRPDSSLIWKSILVLLQFIYWVSIDRQTCNMYCILDFHWILRSLRSTKPILPWRFLMTSLKREKSKFHNVLNILNYFFYYLKEIFDVSFFFLFNDVIRKFLHGNKKILSNFLGRLDYLLTDKVNL